MPRPGAVLARHDGKINRLLRQIKRAVTRRRQAARIGPIPDQPAVRGVQPWRSNSAARSKCAMRRAGTPPSAAPSLDLTIRPRRNRKAEWARRLVRENVLTTDDLIWPMFVVDGNNKRTPVASMPGVDRLSVDQAVRDAERAAKLGIPCIALFPYTDPELRDEHGSRGAQRRQSRLPRDARHQEGIARHRRALRRRARSLHQPRPRRPDARRRDPQRRDGRGAGAQALVQAEAGCDIIAPSDMMDGRVGAIREALDDAGFDRRADHGLCRQICLRLLRPVPRRGRLGQDADRRQAHLPDGPRQLRRGAARGRARHRRRRRHGDGEAGHALSRHRAPREGRLRRADLRLPGVRRVRDDRGRRRATAGSTASAR